MTTKLVNPITLARLRQQWEFHKLAELEAQAARRAIEDEVAAMLELPESLDGAYKGAGSEVFAITGRMDRKVDGDKAQEIAKEHGLEAHLQSLFRWKPEINLTAWRAADPSITAPFAAAVTTKPARASFAVVKDKK